MISKPRFTFVFWLVLSCCSLSACSAQSQLASYTVPSQFRTAKTVFLANAGGNENELIALGYTGFYRALLASGRYTLVTAPADAELVFELSGYSPTTVVNGSSYPYTTAFRLVVRDLKTQTMLWTMYEEIDRSSLQKGVDQALGRLVADLQALAAGTYPQTASPNKSRNAKDKP